MIIKDRKKLLSKHQLVLARREGRKLSKVLRAGDAFFHEGDDYYTIKLAVFPFSFYMRKNSGDNPSYTLFAKRREHSGGTRLQDPIGQGILSDDLLTHIEIKIPILKLSLYMDLFPKH